MKFIPYILLTLAHLSFSSPVRSVTPPAAAATPNVNLDQMIGNAKRLREEQQILVNTLQAQAVSLYQAAGAEDEFKTLQAKLLKEKKTLDMMDQIIQDLTKSKGSTKK